MGFIVTTDEKGIKIYKKIKTNTKGENYAVYSSSISSKDNNGNWKSSYVSLKFKNGVSVNNKSRIKIDNGFWTFNPNMTNGENYPFIMVMDFTVLDEGEDSLQSGISNFDDDLPFM